MKCQSSGQLLAIVDKRLHDFNTTNAITLLHRIASKGGCSVKEPSLRNLLKMLECRITTTITKMRANTTWALEQLKVNSRDHSEKLAAEADLLDTKSPALALSW